MTVPMAYVFNGDWGDDGNYNLEPLQFEVWGHPAKTAVFYGNCHNPLCNHTYSIEVRKFQISQILEISCDFCHSTYHVEITEKTKDGYRADIFLKQNWDRLSTLYTTKKDRKVP